MKRILICLFVLLMSLTVCGCAGTVKPPADGSSDTASIAAQDSLQDDVCSLFTATAYFSPVTFAKVGDAMFVTETVLENSALQYVKDGKRVTIRENVSSINGITPEWVYVIEDGTLLRLSHDGKNEQLILSGIDNAVYVPETDTVVYSTKTTPLEIHCYNVNDRKDEKIYTDDGNSNEFADKDASGCYFGLEKSYVHAGIKYGYPSEVSYVKSLKIEGNKVTENSETKGWDVHGDGIIIFRGDAESYNEVKKGENNTFAALKNEGDGYALYYNDGAGDNLVARSPYVMAFEFFNGMIYYKDSDWKLNVYDTKSKSGAKKDYSADLFVMNGRLVGVDIQVTDPNDTGYCEGQLEIFGITETGDKGETLRSRLFDNLNYGYDPLSCGAAGEKIIIFASQEHVFTNIFDLKTLEFF